MARLTVKPDGTIDINTDATGTPTPPCTPDPTGDGGAGACGGPAPADPGCAPVTADPSDEEPEEPAPWWQRAWRCVLQKKVLHLAVATAAGIVFGLVFSRLVLSSAGGSLAAFQSLPAETYEAVKESSFYGKWDVATIAMIIFVIVILLLRGMDKEGAGVKFVNIANAVLGSFIAMGVKNSIMFAYAGAAAVFPMPFLIGLAIFGITLIIVNKAVSKK